MHYKVYERCPLLLHETGGQGVCVWISDVREVSSFQRMLSSIELGPEDIREVSSFQRVLSSIELGPEDVYIPIREVSSFQRVLCTCFDPTFYQCRCYE